MRSAAICPAGGQGTAAETQFHVARACARGSSVQPAPGGNGVLGTLAGGGRGEELEITM